MAERAAAHAPDVPWSSGYGEWPGASLRQINRALRKLAASVAIPPGNRYWSS